MMTHQKNEKSLFRYYGKLNYLECSHKCFTPWEVLESEYLNNKKFKITEVCLRYIVVSYFVPIKASRYHISIV